jgi:hypothetical protein
VPLEGGHSPRSAFSRRALAGRRLGLSVPVRWDAEEAVWNNRETRERKTHEITEAVFVTYRSWREGDSQWEGGDVWTRMGHGWCNRAWGVTMRDRRGALSGGFKARGTGSSTVGSV